MSPMLLMYLIGQANSIRILFGISSFVLGIFILITSFVGMVECEPKLFKVWKLSPVFIICLLMGVLFPSQQTIILMAGADVVEQIATNPKIQTLAGTSADLVNTYLTHLLDEQKKLESK